MKAKSIFNVDSTVGMAVVAGVAGMLLAPNSVNQSQAAGDGGGLGTEEEVPAYLDLTGLVRDFNERTDQGGHPDFEFRPDHGFAQYCNNISPVLGEDGKPVFTGEGWKLVSDWRDAQGRPICHLLYDPMQGDAEGDRGVSDTGGITSAESFNSWYNDIPGTNMSRALTVRLHRQDDGTYVFDDKDDEQYSSMGGFFPIDDDLFGNPGGSPDHNFHFTYELHTKFTYDADDQQVFRFIGDDDVWVFIDGKLVIDIGGVHSAKDQFVDLTRLGLVDGETYNLDFFFAERHRTQSNFRIVTNLVLESVDLPSVTAAFD